jgi:uncharacterized protein YhfF
LTSVDLTPAGQPAIDEMWASYVATSGYDGPLVTAFAFGDSPELADELGLLVLHGPKRATAGMVEAFEAEGEPLPRVGDRCIVLAGDGSPLGVLRTTDVRVGPLSSVDDAFAWDEGEGDRSRAWWLDAHTRFFTRQCQALGVEFSEDLAVVFERFELVWPQG